MVIQWGAITIPVSKRKQRIETLCESLANCFINIDYFELFPFQRYSCYSSVEIDRSGNVNLKIQEEFRKSTGKKSRRNHPNAV